MGRPPRYRLASAASPSGFACAGLSAPGHACAERRRL